MQDDQHYQLLCEISAIKRQKERLEMKIDKIQKLVENAKKNDEQFVKVNINS